jgi:hypothetical protein
MLVEEEEVVLSLVKEERCVLVMEGLEEVEEEVVMHLELLVQVEQAVL